MSTDAHIFNSAATHPLSDVLSTTGNHPMPLARPDEDQYGGFTRFELELEVLSVISFLVVVSGISLMQW